MERKKLTPAEIAAALPKIAEWREADDRLVRRFVFSNFAGALEFVNKIGEVAEEMDHHPDIKFGWGYVELEITTHDRGGITDVDFELARRINGL